MSSIWNFLGNPESKEKPSTFWNLLGTGKSIDEVSAPRNAAVEEIPCAIQFNEEWVFWAISNLPVTEATKHFLICGATGSGKSVSIQLFLQSIAKRFAPERKTPEQLIIFDAKYDVIPMLSAMGLTLDQPNVWLINPYDRRSAEWNLSEIANTPTMARHVATLLVPEEQNATSGNRYFTDASRELVLATMIALNNIAGDEWTLRDLLCALSDRKTITAVTSQHPRAQQLAARIIDDTQHSAAVLSSIGSKLGRFEQIAALWDNAPKKRVFSIENFLKSPGVLILGNDPVLRESLWPINAILLKSLTSEILRGEDTLRPRHWFILDEFRAMERLDFMPDLLNRGRSKGASVMIGIQGIEGLEDYDVYGRAKTQEMLGQCGYKTFLRVGGPATAEWAQRLFGTARYMESSRSDSWNAEGGHSHSISTDVRDRTALLASTFMNQPFPVAGGVFESINDVAYLRRTVMVRRPFDLLLQWRAQKDDKILALEARKDLSEQTFHPWEKDDIRFFTGKRPKIKKSIKSKKRKRKLPTRET